MHHDDVKFISDQICIEINKVTIIWFLAVHIFFFFLLLAWSNNYYLNMK